MADSTYAVFRMRSCEVCFVVGGTTFKIEGLATLKIDSENMRAQVPRSNRFVVALTAGEYRSLRPVL